MGLAERRDDGGLPFRRKHRLERELGDALLAARLPDRGRRAFAAEERARALGVPGAALVTTDTPCAGFEQRSAHGIECLAGYENDELAVHGVTEPSPCVT